MAAPALDIGRRHGAPLQEPDVLRSEGGSLAVRLEATSGSHLVAGRRATALGYNGGLPGPTLRVRPGDILRIQLVNRLEKPANLHMHGLHVSPEDNGDNVFVVVDPGDSFSYEYRLPGDDPPGVYWYHPHHHGMVADQLFGGLYGAIIVEDADAVPLTRERVLVVSDISLDASGQILTAEVSALLAGAEAGAKGAEHGEDDERVAERVAAAGAKAVPKPKTQRNFTDPESKIMKTSDGSFHQCFNAQEVVDSAHQIVVATDVADRANDVADLMPMAEETMANTGRAPAQMLADAGYCSEDNLNQANQLTTDVGTEFFNATGRQKHDDAEPIAPRGRIPKDATPRQRMARKLTTKKGHAVYARRKVFTLAWTRRAKGEWLLLSACHNLRKLHNNIGIDGLAALKTT